MELLPESGYKRILVAVCYTAIISAVLWLFFRYLAAPLLPFVLAWLIAFSLQPAVRYLGKKTKLSRRILGFVLMALLLAVLCALLVLLTLRLISEARELIDSLSENADSVVGKLFDTLDNLGDRIPLINRIEDPYLADLIQKNLSEMVSGFVTKLSGQIPERIGGFLSGLPDAFFFLAVFILACFYLCTDFAAVTAFLCRRLPETWLTPVQRIRTALVKSVLKYLRAYLLLMGITFVQLLAGFLVMGFPYAFILAIVIAVVDALPVLGVGTVLLPWAAVRMLSGDYYTGGGLLIIYGVIYIVRQLAEPKIVGTSVGLPPLVMLIVMYVGYRLLGFAGLFVFPIAVILLRSVLETGEIQIPKRET